MIDFRHTTLKFATLPLAREIDRSTDPDALGYTKSLLQNSLEQRLDLSNSIRNRGTAFGTRLSGTNSDDAAVAITARVTSLLAIIERKRPI